jgi:hypothetical protein
LILCLVSTSLTFTTLVYGAVGSNVSYDGRSLIIDGQRKLLISASIHYPRSVPAVSTSSLISYTYYFFTFIILLFTHSYCVIIYAIDVAWSYSNSKGRWNRCH